MKAIIFLIATVLFLVSCSLCHYSLDDYNNVEIGQTLQEVQTVLGDPGELISAWVVDSVDHSQYVWSKDSWGSIYANFEDGIVTRKRHFNLK